MPFNLELKIPVTNFKAVTKKLDEIGAVFTNQLNQKDIYFKNKKGLLKLRVENNSSSLISYNRDEKGSKRWSNYHVLYFNNNEAEKFLLNSLETSIIVKKKRLLYMYNNTRIHLDFVTSLGYFLELETLVINGKKDAAKRFAEIIRLLNLDLSLQIKKSYSALLKAKLK